MQDDLRRDTHVRFIMQVILVRCVTKCFTTYAHVQEKFKSSKTLRVCVCVCVCDNYWFWLDKAAFMFSTVAPWVVLCMTRKFRPKHRKTRVTLHFIWIAHLWSTDAVFVIFNMFINANCSKPNRNSLIIVWWTFI